MLPTRQHMYIVRILLVASNCPSDCGWNTHDSCSLMTARENNSCQKCLVKTGSRSLTMELGTPWSFIMLSKKAWATVVVVYGCPDGMKWAYFKNRSTAIRITDLPFTRGNTFMKSIAMSAHTGENLSGCSIPVGWRCSLLLG
jgi:hypothetical protein